MSVVTLIRGGGRNIRPPLLSVRALLPLLLMAAALLPAPIRAAVSPSLNILNPSDVAIDTHGNLYVADTYHNRIVVVSPSGQLLAAWGTFGTAPGRLAGPEGVAVGPTGAVFVADTGNNRVEKFTTGGRLLAVWGSREGGRPGQFRGPAGVAADAAGNVYVADTVNFRIQKLSYRGKPLAVWGGYGYQPGQFKYPQGVTVADGGVYVADTGNHRVQRFTLSGKFQRMYDKPGQMLGPQRVAVDRKGTMFIADVGYQVLMVLTSAGVKIQQWRVKAPPLGAEGEFAGVAIDRRDNVYSLGNNSIQKFSPAGVPLRTWG